MQIGSLIKQLDVSKTGLYEIDDNELEQLHNVLIEMMTDMALFCKKNGIAWCLSGGSVLGAVRHNGFIPWDDDMDIFMTRENFEKFYKLFPKDDPKYEIKRPGDKGYLMHYPQLVKKNTVAQSVQSSSEVENIFIDIFILENTSDNSIVRTVHGCICTMLLFIDSTIRIKQCKTNLLKYGASSTNLIKEVKKRLFFSHLFSFFPIEKWLRLSDKVFSKIINKKSKYVVAPGGAKHYFGEIFERSKMVPYTLTTFEDKRFFIPRDYDYYLKTRYGNNYMIPPLDSEKERHVYIQLSFDTTQECHDDIKMRK